MYFKTIQCVFSKCSLCIEEMFTVYLQNGQPIFRKKCSTCIYKVNNMYSENFNVYFKIGTIKLKKENRTRKKTKNKKYKNIVGGWKMENTERKDRKIDKPVAKEKNHRNHHAQN